MTVSRMLEMLRSLPAEWHAADVCFGDGDVVTVARLLDIVPTGLGHGKPPMIVIIRGTIPDVTLGSPTVWIDGSDPPADR